MRCDNEDNVRYSGTVLADRELGIIRRYDGTSTISVGDGNTPWIDLKPIADNGEEKSYTKTEIDQLSDYAYGNITTLNGNITALKGSLQETVLSIEDRIEIKTKELEDKMLSILPTFDEYAAEELDGLFIQQWSEPKCQCPECHYPMRRKEDLILTCFPPLYEYRCTKCNHSEYLTK
jgi:hypothetical protein